MSIAMAKDKEERRSLMQSAAQDYPVDRMSINRKSIVRQSVTSPRLTGYVRPVSMLTTAISTHSTAIPEPVQQLFSETYTLGRELGMGSFATVYEARNNQTNQLVAAKIFPMEFLSEADIVNIHKVWLSLHI